MGSFSLLMGIVSTMALTESAGRPCDPHAALLAAIDRLIADDVRVTRLRRQGGCGPRSEYCKSLAQDLARVGLVAAGGQGEINAGAKSDAAENFGGGTHTCACHR